ncbi:MAG: L-threonylcarbamoyladenylate synthase [Candidatus Azotimanducaceae bacterium]|jgi:L-threonylcarbamoyladenylate synthase
MKDITLYPTETLYALGVNAHDPEALTVLYELKGRDTNKVSSWLVRDITDIEKYAELGEKAKKIVQHFLPGMLTLVLQTKDIVPREVVAEDGTIGFRISADPVAKKLIASFMEEYGAPLTCTSANVSQSPVFPVVGEILQQFGVKANMITEVIDDGSRKGLASTVVRVVDEDVTILREGEISEADILDVLK